MASEHPDSKLLFFYVVLSGDWGNLFGIIYSFCT